jgi:hypothetical protein
MTKSINTIFGPIDADMAIRFRDTYEKNKGKDTFTFTFSNGVPHPVLESLAKYLIEFLENTGMLPKKGK